MTGNHQPLVLGLHPCSRGIGWALFAGPKSLVDWGVTTIQGDHVTSVRRSIWVLIERHRPEVLVVEDLPKTPRTVIAPALRAAARGHSGDLGLDLVSIGRIRVRDALGLPRRATRQRTAVRVAECVPVLRLRVPPPRKPWEASSRRLAAFSAAALALAYYQNEDAAPPGPQRNAA